MSEYRVLARKYRPQTFEDLVGQEVLVRTLSNAIRSGRIAHAFLLTGIRGIGKTTTARIIARALNCIGEDGQGGATISPCGVCANCVQIREDRHVDVIEMDAASRTGVGDIRDLIETVHYAPTSARYKVYIIDEVHMLSTSAFNALLKTLEEPPANVIFIFATTETRKIPVTILSRCQRFDLKRLDVEGLTNHLQNICAKESVEAEETGLSLISMAAEGSVRDGLSLLDRAISHSIGDDGALTPITTKAIRHMLGLVNKSRLFSMLEALFAGDINAALKLLQEQYDDGGDITLMLGDMLAVIHVMTRLKLDPKDPLGPSYSQAEKEQARELVGKLSISSLSRAWQMTLKGLDEVKRAPDALMAAEMVLIRLAHMADMPSPSDLVKKIQDAGGVSAVANGGGAPSVAPAGGASASQGGGVAMVSAVAGGGAHVSPSPQAMEQPQARGAHLTLAANNPAVALESFEEVVDYIRKQREARLRHVLEEDVALISFEVGQITLKKQGRVDADFPRALADKLQKATSQPWHILFGEGEAEKSIGQKREEHRIAELEEVQQHPLVKSVLEGFSGSKLLQVQHLPDPEIEA